MDSEALRIVGTCARASDLYELRESTRRRLVALAGPVDFTWHIYPARKARSVLESLGLDKREAPTLAYLETDAPAGWLCIAEASGVQQRRLAAHG